jgi:hypothetical protein
MLETLKNLIVTKIMFIGVIAMRQCVQATKSVHTEVN